MIGKQKKFPMRLGFKTFRVKAKKVVTSHITIFYLASKSSRLSVVVPLKVNKLATTRNWLKRLTYSLVYPQIKDLSCDCVVVYKPVLLTKSPPTREILISELSNLKTSFHV